jgi:hypothetical protein
MSFPFKATDEIVKELANFAFVGQFRYISK